MIRLIRPKDCSCCMRQNGKQQSKSTGRQCLMPICLAEFGSLGIAVQSCKVGSPNDLTVRLPETRNHKCVLCSLQTLLNSSQRAASV